MQGLETKRNCGWMGLEPTQERPIVWSGGGAVACQCPVSLSGGLPAAWLELFAMLQGGILTMSADWWAKDLEAMTVLADEARRLAGSE
jgi:hypothetical protein